MNISSLVVGGSKGIGLEIARLFRQRGDEVYVLSRNKGGWEGKHIEADLANISSLERTIDFIKNENIRFRYIVFAQKNRFQPSDWDYEFTVQLKSVQILIEGILPTMDGGAFVFIGSPAGRFIVKEQPLNYHLSKAALEHLAKYYAVNFGKTGIRFNCVMPGTIVKESNAEFFETNKEISDLLKSITPLGILGDAKDIANTVDFLSSDKSRYITGQSILIDGGQSLEGQESLARELKSLQHPNIKKN